jgi:hypothetical protein
VDGGDEACGGGDGEGAIGDGNRGGGQDEGGVGESDGLVGGGRLSDHCGGGEEWGGGCSEVVEVLAEDEEYDFVAL